MSTTFQHIPVMPNEVIEKLSPKPGQWFLDCTLGGAGHTMAILEKTSPDGQIFCLDQDESAIARAKEKLSKYGERVRLFHADFASVEKVISPDIFGRLSGVLLDLGVSSFQLDDISRGFSFQQDGPLDMRMNLSQHETAKTYLRCVREKDLADTIYQLGGETNSRRIAKRIVEYRQADKLNTTFDLVQAVVGAFPKRHYWKIHPATKTFQAIRIKINDELFQAQTVLPMLLARLHKGAKIVVITFHSLEDRIVKNIFRDAKKNGQVQLLTPKPMIPTEQEASSNPRSRSAKLRAVQLV